MNSYLVNKPAKIRGHIVLTRNKLPCSEYFMPKNVYRRFFGRRFFEVYLDNDHHE